MTPMGFTTFPALATERLVLRQVEMEDAPDVFVFRSDPEVQKYDDSAPLRDITEASDLIEKMRAWYASREAITWGVTLKGADRVVGLFALYFWEKRYYVASLGYDLARAYWRRGIATEAARALMKYGFEQMQLHRINVDTRMDNVASARLMSRLGFTHEGIRRECVRSDDGSYQNWGLFGMLRQEYGG